MIDTNVIVATNGNSPQASPKCVENCINALIKIKKSGKIILDTNWLILKEYKNNLSEKGQPGFGDAFLKWILTNIKNQNRCELVEIIAYNTCEDFIEFPDDPALMEFDRSDRKFIAVTRKHSENPPIYQALDYRWRHFVDILRHYSITIEFLCED